MTVLKPRIELATEKTVRVSVREVRETTWRALVATGISFGEAQVAARAVAFSMMHLSSGVESVLRALERGPSASHAVSITSGDTRVIENSAERGFLLMTPLAVGVIAAQPASAPVLLPGLEWDPVLVGFLAQHCGDGAPSFFVFEHCGATLVHGCRVEADTSFTLYSETQLQETSQLNHWLAPILAEASEGLVFVSDFGAFRGVDAPSTKSPADQETTQERVFGHGLQVDRQLWAALNEASKNFLAVGA